jgi:hypothetical protein
VQHWVSYARTMGAFNRAPKHLITQAVDLTIVRRGMRHALRPTAAFNRAGVVCCISGSHGVAHVDPLARRIMPDTIGQKIYLGVYAGGIRMFVSQQSARGVERPFTRTDTLFAPQSISFKSRTTFERASSRPIGATASSRSRKYYPQDRKQLSRRIAPKSQQPPLII